MNNNPLLSIRTGVHTTIFSLAKRHIILMDFHSNKQTRTIKYPNPERILSICTGLEHITGLPIPIITYSQVERGDCGDYTISLTQNSPPPF